MDFLFGILSCIIFMTIFIVIPLFFKYITIKLAMRKSRVDNLSPIDFSKEKEYYREILKEYTPAELSYIDDFKIDTKREIVATLLNLELKKRVELTQNEIIVIDRNTIGLGNTEKFILENIKEGRVKIEKEGDFHLVIQKEAKLDGLTIKNEEYNKSIKISTIISLIIWFSILVVLIIYIEYGKNFFLGFGGVLIWALITIIAVPVMSTYKITYSIMKEFGYRRSEKGEEINKKIEGLKQYIKDYSLLNEREKEDLIIWEEYLIYSVIFDLNTTETVKDIYKLIDIKYELGKFYFVKNEKKVAPKIIIPK